MIRNTRLWASHGQAPRGAVTDGGIVQGDTGAGQADDRPLEQGAEDGEHLLDLRAAHVPVARHLGEWELRVHTKALLPDHLHDHLSFGMPLLEVVDCVGDVRKWKNTVNHYLKLLLIDEGRQF